MATSRQARAFAAELASAYPNSVSRDTLAAWAETFEDIGLTIADDVSALLRVRSTFPPSVAQIYEAAREIRKETQSPMVDTSRCVYVDGATCFNCDPNGIVHGHLMDAGEMFHGAYHLGRGELERARHPERCDCGFVVPDNVDPTKVMDMLIEHIAPPRLARRW